MDLFLKTLLVPVSLAILVGCSGEEKMFSQRQGFECIRDAQSSLLPDEREQALLERHKPKLFVSEGAEGPLDFYADYIASGTLSAEGKKDNDAVDQAALNEVKLNPTATFTHKRASGDVSHVGYGSVHYGTVDLIGLDPPMRDWTFLRYHFAFRTSGIAMGVKGWQGLLMGVAGSLDDWHQLDHYTAIVVALDETDRPAAVMLQQHNYKRTYIVGTDPAFPAGGPFMVDVAKRSNELYPHRDRPTMHRAASFISSDSVAWLAGTSDEMPSLGTYDATSPDREIDYELKFLRPDDAFYVFVGRLGEKRMLPGRDGPPGAIYYTLPEIWEYEKSLPMFYWTENDEEFARLYSEPMFSIETGKEPALAAADGGCLAAPQHVIEKQRERLAEALLGAGFVG